MLSCTLLDASGAAAPAGAATRAQRLDVFFYDAWAAALEGLLACGAAVTITGLGALVRAPAATAAGGRHLRVVIAEPRALTRHIPETQAQPTDDGSGDSGGDDCDDGGGGDYYGPAPKRPRMTLGAPAEAAAGAGFGAPQSQAEEAMQLSQPLFDSTHNPHATLGASQDAAGAAASSQAAPSTFICVVVQSMAASLSSPALLLRGDAAASANRSSSGGVPTGGRGWAGGGSTTTTVDSYTVRAHAAAAAAQELDADPDEGDLEGGGGGVLGGGGGGGGGDHAMMATSHPTATPAMGSASAAASVAAAAPASRNRRASDVGGGTQQRVRHRVSFAPAERASSGGKEGDSPASSFLPSVAVPAHAGGRALKPLAATPVVGGSHAFLGGIHRSPPGTPSSGSAAAAAPTARPFSPRHAPPSPVPTPTPAPGQAALYDDEGEGDADSGAVQLSDGDARDDELVGVGRRGGGFGLAITALSQTQEPADCAGVPEPAFARDAAAGGGGGGAAPLFPLTAPDTEGPVMAPRDAVPSTEFIARQFSRGHGSQVGMIAILHEQPPLGGAAASRHPAPDAASSEDASSISPNEPASRFEAPGLSASCAADKGHAESMDSEDATTAPVVTPTDGVSPAASSKASRQSSAAASIAPEPPAQPSVCNNPAFSGLGLLLQQLANPRRRRAAPVSARPSIDSISSSNSADASLGGELPMALPPLSRRQRARSQRLRGRSASTSEGVALSGGAPTQQPAEEGAHPPAQLDAVGLPSAAQPLEPVAGGTCAGEPRLKLSDCSAPIVHRAQSEVPALSATMPPPAARAPPRALPLPSPLPQSLHQSGLQPPQPALSTSAAAAAAAAAMDEPAGVGSCASGISQAYQPLLHSQLSPRREPSQQPSQQPPQQPPQQLPQQLPQQQPPQPQPQPQLQRQQHAAQLAPVDGPRPPPRPASTSTLSSLPPPPPLTGFTSLAQLHRDVKGSAPTSAASGGVTFNISAVAIVVDATFPKPTNGSNSIQKFIVIDDSAPSGVKPPSVEVMEFCGKQDAASALLLPMRAGDVLVMRRAKRDRYNDVVQLVGKLYTTQYALFDGQNASVGEALQPYWFTGMHAARGALGGVQAGGGGAMPQQPVRYLLTPPEVARVVQLRGWAQQHMRANLLYAQAAYTRSLESLADGQPPDFVDVIACVAEIDYIAAPLVTTAGRAMASPPSASVVPAAPAGVSGATTHGGGDHELQSVMTLWLWDGTGRYSPRFRPAPPLTASGQRGFGLLPVSPPPAATVSNSDAPPRGAQSGADDASTTVLGVLVELRCCVPPQLLVRVAAQLRRGTWVRLRSLRCTRSVPFVPPQPASHGRFASAPPASVPTLYANTNKGSGLLLLSEGGPAACADVQQRLLAFEARRCEAADALAAHQRHLQDLARFQAASEALQLAITNPLPVIAYAGGGTLQQPGGAFARAAASGGHFRSSAASVAGSMLGGGDEDDLAGHLLMDDGASSVFGGCSVLPGASGFNVSSAFPRPALVASLRGASQPQQPPLAPPPMVPAAVVYVPALRQVAPFDLRTSEVVTKPLAALSDKLSITPISEMLSTFQRALATAKASGRDASAAAQFFRVRGRLAHCFPTTVLDWTTPRVGHTGAASVPSSQLATGGERSSAPPAAASPSFVVFGPGQYRADVRKGHASLTSTAAVPPSSFDSGGSGGSSNRPSSSKDARNMIEPADLLPLGAGSGGGGSAATLDSFDSRPIEPYPQHIPAEPPATEEWVFAFCLQLEDKSGAHVDVRCYGMDVGGADGLFAGTIPACDMRANSECASTLVAVLETMCKPNSWLDVVVAAAVDAGGQPSFRLFGTRYVRPW